MAPPAEAPTGRGPLLLQASSRGSSAQTFHGMLAYITWARPAIVIFENVEDIVATDGIDGLSKPELLTWAQVQAGFPQRENCGTQQAIVSCGPPVRAMLEDGPSCILSPYGWSGIEQAEVHCLGGERDAITSELPEKRTDAQEAETYSGETVERSTAQPVDHQIPSCDMCGEDTYALACERCGIRFCQVCDNLADCACPPGTGRYRGPR